MNSTNPQINYSPLDLGLLSYQAAFAANNSRFKIGLWARQTGKDYTATAEAVVVMRKKVGPVSPSGPHASLKRIGHSIY